jgi:hypothetical protein
MHARVFFLMVAIAGSLLFWSCDEELNPDNINCAECYYEKPYYGSLKVHVTLNTDNLAVPVVFYKQKFSDKIKDNPDYIEWIDTMTTSTYYLHEVVMNNYYSAVAFYKGKNGEEIRVVDGDEIITRLVSTYCGDACYIIRGGELDLRLKTP